jgi:hypothetical protein
MRELPIYKVIVNDIDQTGTDFISLVKEPAIEVGFHAFSIDKDRYSFKTLVDKQKLMGPVAIPDMKIYRNDEELGEYYIVFSAETIQKMADKFNRSSKSQSVNLDHQPNSKIESAYVSENWIIEGENDKSKGHGFELPVGTWMATIHVADKDVWNDTIKTGNVLGFSLEGMLGMEKQKLNKIMETKIELANKTTKDGVILYATDFTIGAAVFTDEAQTIPAEDKEYVLEDDSIITIVEGKVAENKVEEVVKEEEEAVIEDAPVKNEIDMEALAATVADLLERIAILEAGSVDMKTENENLSAKVAELSAMPATTSITKLSKNVIQRAAKLTIEEQVTKLRNMVK